MQNQPGLHCSMGSAAEAAPGVSAATASTAVVIAMPRNASFRILIRPLQVCHRGTAQSSRGADADLRSRSAFQWFNDKMTSYWNRSKYTYLVFEHSNYRGGCLATVRPGESTSAVPPWANDAATSARRWRKSDVHRFCQG